MAKVIQTFNAILDDEEKACIKAILKNFKWDITSLINDRDQSDMDARVDFTMNKAVDEIAEYIGSVHFEVDDNDD